MAGIVRAARRPAGWVAPGPRPPGPRGDLSLWPGAGEDLCWLAGDWRILQRRDGHRWSLDDLASAWFAAGSLADPPRRIADLGCGIGTVLLLLAWLFPEARGVGIEAQSLSAALAGRSLRLNGADGRCAVRHGDLRDDPPAGERAAFDLVTGTPPYLPPGTGLASTRPQRAPARLEWRGGIEAYAAAAARRLAPQGRFAGCAPASVDRLEAAARGAGLSLERVRAVVPRAGKAPLFLLHAMGRPDAVRECRVEPPLVVRDHLGRRTAECRAMRRAFGIPD